MSEAGASAAATSGSKSPLFLFGVDHSGNTIIYRMLAYHPDLTWFSQFSLRGGEIPGRSRRPAAGRLDSVLRVLPHVWEKGDPWPRRLLVPRPDTDERIWRNLLEEDEATAAERVRSRLEALSSRHGGRRVLAKRPGFHRHLGILRDAFPEARFVHIVRDGRPVALSNRKKILDGQAARGGGLSSEEALRSAAKHWVDVLDRARQTPGIDLLEVHYERFCDDVHGVLREVLEHSGLIPESFPFHRCPRKLENRNGRWTDDASGDELEEITRIQAQALTRHGYGA